MIIWLIYNIFVFNTYQVFHSRSLVFAPTFSGDSTQSVVKLDVYYKVRLGYIYLYI